MRTSRTLHVFGVAAFWLAVATGGGSVHARRAPSQPLSGAAIGQVACSAATPPRMTRSATFNAEVLLDRLDISPGIIDGKTGENVGKAIAAFQRSRGLAVSGKLGRTTWGKLCESTNAPALIAYTITDDDVRGPFVPEGPRDLDGMARLSQLGYRSAAELLAEKFHSSEELIKLLNPGKTVDRAGTVISVPDVAGGRPEGRGFRVEGGKPTRA